MRLVGEASPYYLYVIVRKVLETVRTLDNDEVDLIKPLRRDNPENVKRVEFILSEENFQDLFPRRHSSYTYTRLLQVIPHLTMPGVSILLFRR